MMCIAELVLGNLDVCAAFSSQKPEPSNDHAVSLLCVLCIIHRIVFQAAASLNFKFMLEKVRKKSYNIHTLKRFSTTKTPTKIHRNYMISTERRRS